MDDIGTTKVLTIGECGHDEYWLRDRIFADPTILGLGDLQAIMREKNQSQGGRLDLLLKNPEDDSMFEVELQLGATDESHIVRTIEYWDGEKRRWPNRSHTAVLVAETINNRFFNVVHLLSLAVPIIGIQANIVQAGDKRALHFHKVIDSYEEPEEAETAQQPYDETQGFLLALIAHVSLGQHDHTPLSFGFEGAIDSFTSCKNGTRKHECHRYCANSLAGIKSFTLHFLSSAARASAERMMNEERDRSSLRAASTRIALSLGRG